MKLKPLSEKLPTPYDVTRRITRFAFFPITINGERIWFEKYYVYQRWTKEGSNRKAYDGMFVTRYYDAWVTFKKETIKTSQPLN